MIDWSVFLRRRASIVDAIAGQAPTAPTTAVAPAPPAGPLCTGPGCRQPLTYSPSEWFCSDPCQRNWHTTRADTTTAPTATLPGTDAVIREQIRARWV